MFDSDSVLFLIKQRREEIRQEIEMFHLADEARNDEARTDDQPQASEMQGNTRKALIERLIDVIILLP